ncbi:CoA transferase [Streptomyces sulphureus]|uniref:CoA transferase n=1 Tax=Streptomyces sulphureus TaxID=47758 RepID=UPI00037CC009|nr:CoA transferase [Streptomyces sulphureus]
MLPRLAHRRRSGLLPSALPVQGLATCSVAACSLAAAEFTEVRSPGPGASYATVDDAAVASAFASDRHLRVDGRAVSAFAALSRFWPTADGWVRTHANYPHHRARLLRALGLSSEPAPGTDSEEQAVVERLGTEIARRTAAEVEETVCAGGGLAFALRSPEAWSQHPQRIAESTRPLVRTARLDEEPPAALGRAAVAGPLDGLRVLDLTRVVAGPVATRTLGALGADVLRLDPPHLPELPDTWADTGFGKRSATLDLAGREGRNALERLLAEAHVVLTAYRPAALDRFGCTPEALAARRPGLVVGRLCAWGESGPWRHRRGFDSLVQTATGIASLEAAPDGAPGALPVQALDHATGYLLAAAVLRSLTDQRTGTPGSRVLHLSLARTAAWLTDELPHEPQPSDGPQDEAAPVLRETDSPLGRLRYVPSPIAQHCPGPQPPEPITDWIRPPSLFGADACEWRRPD